MTEQTDSTAPLSSPRVRRRIAPAVTFLSLVGIVPAVGFWMADDTPVAPDDTQAAVPTDGELTTSDGTSESDSQLNSSVPEELSPEDAERARLLVGVWKQERFGQRRMTVKADGSATMVIRPEGLLASTFGFDKQLDLQMYWKVKDGHIDYGVSGGTPPDQVKTASSMWGDHWVEKIEALSDQELILLDQSTSAPSKWQRVPESELDADADDAAAETPESESKPGE